MKLNELCELLVGPTRIGAISDLVGNSSLRSVSLDGLSGSSASFLFSKMPKVAKPYLVVTNDLDEAGYMYNDLVHINGEESVLLFPSGYKRDIKYGQEDPPSQILRAEVLNRWGDGRLRWVVTYPEALAEKVASKEKIDAQTIQFTVGGTADLIEVEKRLREYGFEEVDYVYEPGQFAVRGSILDIFSFANEMPYRVDFFGDDIESIRMFNIESQLSEAQLESICVVNNISGRTPDAQSMLDFAGRDTILLVHDRAWLLNRVASIAGETISQSTVIAREGDANAMLNIVSPEKFTASLDSMRFFEYSYQGTADYDARLSFDTSPQGLLHKNFDLISQLFKDYESRDIRFTYFQTMSHSLQGCVQSLRTEAIK